MRHDRPAAESRRAGERMALDQEWNDVLAEIRALDGFADFLKPPRLDALRLAATGGPVVMVNVSQWRSDALIVTEGGVLPPLELPEASQQRTTEWAARYLEAVHRFQLAEQETYEAQRRFREGDQSPAAFQEFHAAAQRLHTERLLMETVVTEVLDWLWAAISDPVLTHLGFTQTPPDDAWPRLWWCPTGLLTALPLHAAGRHGAKESVLDRVIPSYTPTLRALHEATNSRSPAPRPELLVVAVPDAPGQTPLPNVDREADLLARLFPGDRSTVLYGADATTTRVREELGRHHWAHFSCHGHQDLTDPSNGGLLLYDGTLTVQSISNRTDLGEFAFLSACKTATGGLDLADEVITLAAALHYAGYRQVVATLWSVYDPTAADVVESVYTELCSDGQVGADGAAAALHRVVRRLRDQHPASPSVWTPFVHLGP
ncbi:CHAT domain-containing protein [Kribbella sp. NPDC050124]|uniref:CHAT domain-containing protein n=1 Tax=Kribbella sp. NPDC050124 TaxID=3364114 RepID=UPI00378CF280